MADYSKRYLNWTVDDVPAAQLIELFGKLQHLADDFIDDEANATMSGRSDQMTEILDICLVQIPLNSFYREHSAWIVPIITSVLVQINCADHWYNSEAHEQKQYSFVWRTAAEQLIYQIAYLRGGLKHAQRVGRQYREIWLSEDEDHSYKLWKEEHA